MPKKYSGIIKPVTYSMKVLKVRYADAISASKIAGTNKMVSGVRQNAIPVKKPISKNGVVRGCLPSSDKYLYTISKINSDAKKCGVRILCS